MHALHGNGSTGGWPFAGTITRLDANRRGRIRPEGRGIWWGEDVFVDEQVVVLPQAAPIYPGLQVICAAWRRMPGLMPRAWWIMPLPQGDGSNLEGVLQLEEPQRCRHRATQTQQPVMRDAAVQASPLVSDRGLDAGRPSGTGREWLELALADQAADVRSAGGAGRALRTADQGVDMWVRGPNTRAPWLTQSPVPGGLTELLEVSAVSCPLRAGGLLAVHRDWLRKQTGEFAPRIDAWTREHPHGTLVVELWNVPDSKAVQDEEGTTRDLQVVGRPATCKVCEKPFQFTTAERCQACGARRVVVGDAGRDATWAPGAPSASGGATWTPTPSAMPTPELRPPPTPAPSPRPAGRPRASLQQMWSWTMAQICPPRMSCTMSLRTRSRNPIRATPLTHPLPAAPKSQIRSTHLATEMKFCQTRCQIQINPQPMCSATLPAAEPDGKQTIAQRPPGSVGAAPLTSALPWGRVCLAGGSTPCVRGPLQSQTVSRHCPHLQLHRLTQRADGRLITMATTTTTTTETKRN